MINEEFFSNTLADMDLQVIFSGRESCLPLHKFEGLRNHYILHYIVAGEGKIKINNKTFNLSTGSAFFIFPDQLNFYQASKNNPWYYKWIGFSGNKTDRILQSAGITRSSPIIINEYTKEIDDYMDELFNNLKIRNEGFELKVNGLFYLILSIFADINKKVNLEKIYTGTKIDYVKKILEFIEINFQRNISVNQMAEYLGINRSYLSILFKNQKGISLKDFLIDYRIMKAKELLVKSNMNISEIAYSVGYKDYFSFTKIFRKITGERPKEYRNKNINIKSSCQCKNLNKIFQV
jgi:AraC-like DNA-binding protein